MTKTLTRGLALFAVAGAAMLTVAQNPSVAGPLGFSATPPAGAVVLLDGTLPTLKANWYTRYTKNDAAWTVANGAYSNDGKDITSKAEFGDCIVYAEFRTPEQGDGNAGISFQGRYEIQIYENFGKPLNKNNGGAMYDQRPANVNAAKPAGQWQAYLIIFRAPRFDASGNVTEKARVTVFQNGVLIHNNEAFTGPTGIQYGEFKGEAPKGPLSLQGDHGKVQFRNLWVLPG